MSEESQALANVAELACERAKRAGAQGARGAVSLARSVVFRLRDGKKEEVKAAVRRKLSLTVYVDGRYGTHSTSQLERQDVESFVDDAVEMTRLLMKDTHRALVDPKLYTGRAAEIADLFDPSRSSVTMAQREVLARASYEAARQRAGSKLISVGTGVSDSATRYVLRTTNGFADEQLTSGFWQWASVTVKDPSGRRPSDWEQLGGPLHKDLGDPQKVGAAAADRALATIGAKAIPSCTLPVIVENRAVGRLLSGLLGPLSGHAVDQGRSCFAKSQQTRIGARLLSIHDDPSVAGGLASRRFDAEGITARPFAVIDQGVLKAFYLDGYYASKLGVAPTTGGESNLVLPLGARDVDGLCQQAGKALLVCGFLGGNSNSTTGDFSHGIHGFLIEGGKRVAPIASMNLAGNHRHFWQGLLELGNDPYRYSRRRTPSMLFSPLLVSGT